MTIAFEILKLIGKGIELGCNFVFGMILLAVVCGVCTAAAEVGAASLVILVLLAAVCCVCCSWVCKLFAYKRFLRTSSLGYLGLLCAFAMTGAGFLYGLSLSAGHIR